MISPTDSDMTSSKSGTGENLEKRLAIPIIINPSVIILLVDQKAKTITIKKIQYHLLKAETTSKENKCLLTQSDDKEGESGGLEATTTGGRLTRNSLAGESPKQVGLKSVVSPAWLEGGKRCGSVTHDSPTTREGLCVKRRSMSQCW